MMDIERLFRKADFSAESNFKEKLAKKLFANEESASAKITSIRKVQAPQLLSDDDLDMVSAARGGVGLEDPASTIRE